MSSKKLTLYILSLLISVSLSITIISSVRNFFIKGNKTTAAVSSVVEEAVSVNAVLIRDEHAVRTTKQGVVSYCVQDAGKVGIGSKIADVYETEEDVDKVRQIREIEERIDLLESVQNPGTSLSATPSKVASKVYDMYKNILYKRSSGNIAAVLDDESELTRQWDTYNILVNETADYGEEIKNLRAQRVALMAATNSPVDRVRANKSAYFISYADGYESQLYPDMIDSLDSAALADIKDDHSIDDSRVIGKIVTGYRWYAVGAYEESPAEFEAGDEVTVRFSSTSVTADAVVESVRKDDRGMTVIVVSSDEFDEGFVRHRREPMQIIRNTYKGIKVMKDYLRFADVTEEAETDSEGNIISEAKTENVRGVYILDGEEVAFRKVDVIYETDNCIVSDITDEEGYLHLYDQIITEGDDLGGG